MPECRNERLVVIAFARWGMEWEDEGRQGEPGGPLVAKSTLYAGR